jgi:hypothetical protein
MHANDAHGMSFPHRKYLHPVNTSLLADKSFGHLDALSQGEDRSITPLPLREEGRLYDSYLQHFNAPPLQGETQTLENSNSMHRWPWRGLGFASDLGTLGYLLKIKNLGPVFGVLGWAVSLPYYAYSVISKPNEREKKKEALFQVTANGIFPFLLLKMGIKLGEKLHKKVSPLPAAERSCLSYLKTAPSAWKLLVGLGVLAIGTPFVGDPLGKLLVGKFFPEKNPSEMNERLLV